jgi:hypothetical protein
LSEIVSAPGALQIFLNTLHCHCKNTAIFTLISNLFASFGFDISEIFRLQFVRAFSNDLSDKVLLDCGLRAVNQLIKNWSISNSEFCTLVPVLLAHANVSSVSLFFHFYLLLLYMHQLIVMIQLFSSLINPDLH